MNLNEKEKQFLKELVIEKLLKQQSLESSISDINDMPKSLLKKIDSVSIDNDDLMLPPDFEHTVRFDNVVFMNGKKEVGRITLGK